MGNIAGSEPQVGRGQAGERLDGWKAIAAYLKRDRSTVIRWTRDRGLPVHRVPGGLTGTVFALRHELDQWLGLPSTNVDDRSPASSTTASAPVDPPRDVGRPAAKKSWLTAVGVVAFIVAALAAIVVNTSDNAQPASTSAAALVLPKNPETAAKFLAARDLVAERDAAGLERAIGFLEEVVSEAPDYPLGHASLAEALLLSREFGMRTDAEAFADARIAVRAAGRLAPDMALGHRMLGFLAYWADGDFTEADAQFRRALALDPNDAYSHFWYGNILSDHGNHAAGLAELSKARLLLPGSVAIATDLAWAQWAAGQDAVAKAALGGILQDHPDFAVAYDALSIILLSDGDYAGYAQNFARYAALKQDERLIDNARLVQEALQRGADAGREEIMRQALADTVRDQKRNHAWLAMIASAGGDRAQLRAILLTADRRRERWNTAGFRRHLEGTWRQDPEISALLARRSPAYVEPAR